MKTLVLSLIVTFLSLPSQNAEADLVEDGSRFEGTYKILEQDKACGYQTFSAQDVNSANVTLETINSVFVLASPKELSIHSLAFPMSHLVGFQSVLLKLQIFKNSAIDNGSSPVHISSTEYVSSTELISITKTRLDVNGQLITVLKNLSLDENKNLIMTERVTVGDKQKTTVCHFLRI